MARTIEDLEKEISDTKAVLATMPEGSATFKNARKVLEGNIERFQKRITDIRNNTVKLGDGKPATVGTEVYGYTLPKISDTGSIVGYEILKRLVAGTKKIADKPGILYFGIPTQKYERLPSYESTRFYSTEAGAKGEAMLQATLAVENAEAELAKVKSIANFVATEKIKVRDLTKDPDQPKSNA